MLTLYHGVTSTCSKRVRICLAEKELAWNSIHIDLSKFEHLNPDYFKINPNGVVPALDHDGRILFESNFINEYLDDCFPETPLRPADLYERARMRIWMDRFEHVLHRNINTISFIKQNRYKRYEGLSEAEIQAMLDRQPNEAKRVQLATRIRDGIQPEEMDYAEARIAEVLDEMEGALGDRPWLNGDNISLADIAVAPFFERFENNRLTRLVDWSARPALGGWWARMQDRASFKTAFAFRPPDNN
ncbi:MAG: glutathione S-transferase family protein [Alphaproteobacteria bacterium]